MGRRSRRKAAVRRERREAELRRLLSDEDPVVDQPPSGLDVLRLLGYGGLVFVGLGVLLQLLALSEIQHDSVLTQLLGTAFLLVGGLYIDARVKRNGRGHRFYLILTMLIIVAWLLGHSSPR